MRNIWRILGWVLIASLWLGMGACESEPEPDEVARLEAQLQAAFDAPTLDPKQVRELSGKLANALLVRADANPEAAQTPEDLLRAANLYEQNPAQIPQALNVYDRLVREYPGTEYVADALFKQGYLYHNVVGDLPRAERAFRTFLAEYPAHELANSARDELAYLGVPPEEVLRQKLEAVAQDSATSDTTAP